jgi:hypothetical protein
MFVKLEKTVILKTEYLFKNQLINYKLTVFNLLLYLEFRNF